MANVDDLRRLAQEVANAYEERVKSISDIKRNTADFLAQTREEIKEREAHVENLWLILTRPIRRWLKN